MRAQKKALFLLMLALGSALLCGCKQNPSQEQLFSKLIGYFESRGYACALAPLADTQPEADVAIYNAIVWYRLTVGGEDVLVYFDESNRADYLCSQIDEDKYGYVTRFGLRFVLTYPGNDSGVLKALESINT